ncbi:NHL repeat protein [Leptospira fainei serovar Hurstbridge str. BUT 6]|uniref:NHL repeat protein n=1 Tax=Leptospira fainei serovar Hurstbridge str. BUT 6 TaxID=1193011 RepID=S3W4D0_9LEPT|nr:NHL repeat-containing protein [Leptospira fainei]EPG75137.1 NHL repeat protein [Leptospira fainei serovar Hurstbridge str. BUT 6]
MLDELRNCLMNPLYKPANFRSSFLIPLVFLVIFDCNQAKPLNVDMSHGSGFLLSLILGNLSTSGGGGCAIPSLSSGENATVVLGQTDFASSGFGSGAAQLHYPQGITHDSKGGIWVSDTQNQRIIHYPSTVTSGGTPDIVLGGTLGSALNQFNNPQAVAVDAAGGIWVADYLNHRILHFPSGVASGGSADTVIGTSGISGVSTTLLNSPRGVAVEASGGLWVVDTGNNRMLHFSPPLTNGKAADLVLGQTSFTSGGTTSASASTLANPNSVTMDSSGGIWVSDASYHRTLHFSSPFANDMNADTVLGQSTFGSSTPSTSQSGLWTPTGLSTDANGGLWVADYGNRRAIHFSAPFTNGKNGDNVLGEPNYTSNNSGNTVSAALMGGPNALTVSPCGQLWVADYSDHRVLYYP